MTDNLILKFALIIALLINAGCMHKPLPNLPKDWTGKEVLMEELDDKPDVATLQLIIVYGDTVCNHTASRFYCPGKGALFWDPGGNYASKGHVKAVRKNDIFENMSSLNTYLHWRTLVPSAASEIFVWDVDQQEICDLYDRVAAARIGDKILGFNSDAAGLFCAAATSEFLRDYATKLMKVDKWGLPHNLSKQLHQNGSADRIYIVDHRSNTIKQYFP